MTDNCTRVKSGAHLVGLDMRDEHLTANLCLLVQRAIKSFRKGSAPGPDGLRAEHLKVAIKSTPSRQDKAEEAITSHQACQQDGRWVCP